MTSKPKGKRGFFGFWKRKAQEKPRVAPGGVEISAGSGAFAEDPATGDQAQEAAAQVVQGNGVRQEAKDVSAAADVIADVKAEDALLAGEAYKANSKKPSVIRGLASLAPEVSKEPGPEKASSKRASRNKKGDEEDEIALPINIAVDFYRGVRERDAEQIARAFVEKNFASPNASYIYVQKWRDGCAVEMQEGGGRAYLPEVLAQLDSDPDTIMALPMSGRVMQVRLDSETGLLEALSLPAQQEPAPAAFIALPTKNMTPIDRRGAHIFAVGTGLFAASMIALMFSVGGFFIDTDAWSRPYLQQTRVKDLPSAQIPRIEAAMQEADCIARLEYVGGEWLLYKGWDDGHGNCTSNKRSNASVNDTNGAVGMTGTAPAAGSREPAPVIDRSPETSSQTTVAPPAIGSVATPHTSS